MSKCKHEDNWSLIELMANTSTEHIKTEGGNWHNNEPGDYTGKVIFECLDCGHEGTYYLRTKSCPKYIRARFDEATSPGFARKKVR